MKFSSNQSELLFYLQACIKMSPLRSTITSLEGIYIACLENNLELAATNLESGIRCNLPVKIDREGAVVLPSKVADIVRLISDSEIDIEVNDKFIASIFCSNTSFQLNGLDPLDFPQMPEMNMDFDWSIQTDDFKEMIKQTVFCVSGDEGKAALTGLHFTIKNDQIILTSSDSFRVSLKKSKITNLSGKEVDFIVPIKILNEFVRFNFNDENINIKLDDEKNQIIFRVDQFIFFSKLIEEKYPNVERVIPKNFSTHAVVSKSELISCLQRIILISQGNNFIAKIQLTDKKAVFSANSEVGCVEEVVEIEKQGEDVDIYLNSKYLLEPLMFIQGDKIEINLKGTNLPCVINLFEQQDSYLYLVLPIKS